MPVPPLTALLKPGPSPDPSNRVVEIRLGIGPFAAGVLRRDPAPAAAVARRHMASAAPDEDAAWVRLAQGGDREAFRRLVERHRDRAWALAHRIVRDPRDADEVTQDAFVRAWRALPGFRGDARFGTWLHRIVVRRALDRSEVHRNRRRHESPFEAAREAVDPAPLPSEPPAVEDSRLERILGALGEVPRLCIVLFHLHDRSLRDVAQVLGLPENTVKTHLRRARARMREVWELEGDGA